jgi:MFS family permease
LPRTSLDRKSTFATTRVVRIALVFMLYLCAQATPLYLSEMAPFKLRGALNIMFQLAVTIGILAAQLINFGTQHIQPYGWRISLGMGAVPSLMLFFGAMMLPDTPNSLIQRGRPEEGRKVLQRVCDTEHVDT